MASGFTPAIRRPKPIYTESPILQNQAHWTAARCQRLLRPIASRVQLLQKERRIFQKLEDRYEASPDVPTRSSHESVTHCGKFTARDEDPEWIPDRLQRKRVKHKYCSKSERDPENEGPPHKRRRYKSTDRAPGEVILPTPLLQRMDRCHSLEGLPLQASPMDVYSAQRDNSSSWKHRSLLQKLKTTLSSSQRSLVDGLYNSLETLLKATQKSSPQRRGAASLLSTAMRKIPQYIKEEELWQDSLNNSEKMDVSSVIYGDLESFGGRGNQGWKSLRETVRAHGIAMLSDAIYDGSLSFELATGLIEICISMGAHKEGEALLQAMTSNSIPKPKTINDTHQTLTALESFAHRTHQRGFHYRQLSCMLRDGRIPVEWLATRHFMNLWATVFQSISHSNQESADGLDFCGTALGLVCGWKCSDETAFAQSGSLPGVATLTSGEPSEAPQLETFHASTNIISSIATILGTSAYIHRKMLASNDFERPAQFPPMIRLLLLSISEISTKMGPQIARDLAGDIRHRAAMLSFAAILLIPNDNPLEAGRVSRYLAINMHWLESVLADTPGESDMIYGLANLLCSISRCTGKALQGDTFVHLQNSIEHVLSFVSNHGDLKGQERAWLRNIAIKAALQYATDTGSHRHLEWAEELEDEFVRDELMARTPRVNVAKKTMESLAGYRWEEGICEWIVATPAPPSQPPPDTSEDESEERIPSDKILDDMVDDSVAPKKLTSLSDILLGESPLTERHGIQPMISLADVRSKFDPKFSNEISGKEARIAYTKHNTKRKNQPDQRSATAGGAKGTFNREEQDNIREGLKQATQRPRPARKGGSIPKNWRPFEDSDEDELLVSPGMLKQKRRDAPQPLRSISNSKVFRPKGSHFEQREYEISGQNGIDQRRKVHRIKRISLETRKSKADESEDELNIP